MTPATVTVAVTATTPATARDRIIRRLPQDLLQRDPAHIDHLTQRLRAALPPSTVVV